MSQFLLDRIDYIFFFYGLAFLVMAQVCLSMRRPDGEPRWFWLALFGLSHGANEWLDLIANSFGDSFWFSVLRNFLLLLSFILLMEFARRSQIEIRGNGPGTWLHLPMLAIVALGLLDGLTGFNAAARYVYGLVSGLWAAYVMYVASGDRDRRGSMWLLPAALVMAAYALATGLVVPKASFPPATFINYGSFAGILGFPVQLARGVLAIFAAVSILLYSHPSYRSQRFAASYPAPFYTFFPVAFVLMLLVGGWYFTEEMGTQDVEGVSRTIESNTLLAARLIQLEDLDVLTTPDTAEAKEPLERVRNTMELALDTAAGARSVCLVEADEGHSVMASVFEREAHVMRRSCDYHDLIDMDMPATQFAGPVNLDGESWVVSSAPVLDRRGRLRAQLILGLDGGMVRGLILLDRFYGILVTGSICLLAILFLTFWQRSRESSAQRLELGLARQKLADEKRLREITSALGEGVMVIDLGGRMTFMNPEAERLLGWTEGELMGKDIHAIIRHRHVDGAAPDKDNCPSCRVVETGVTYHSDEEIFTRKDGSVFQVSYVAAPIIIENRVAGAVTAFQDITPRKKAERELKESELSYRTLSENLPGMVFRVHLGGKRMQFFNDMVEPMTGYTVEELGTGGICSIEPYIVKEDLSGVLNTISLSMMEGAPYQVEYRLVRKDGATRFFMERGRPVRGQDGSYQYIDGVILDVTDSKRIEERFSRVNECLLSFGPEPEENISKLTSLCGELMGASVAAYNRVEGEGLVRVAGWNIPDEFPVSVSAKGKVCYDIAKRESDSMVYIEDLQNSTYAKTDPVVERSGMATYIGQPVRVVSGVTGILCMMYRSVYSPTDPDRELVSLLASAIGVEEERRLAGEELKKFMFIVEGAGEEIYLLNTEGNVLYANTAACGSLGYTRYEMDSLSAQDFMVDMTRNGYKEHVAELRERDLPPFEAEHRTKSGKIIPKEVKSAFIEIGGEEYVCSFARDITERRDLEKKKDDFFGMVTHDLKSPLSIILGYMDIMMTDFKEEIPEQVLDMAESVRSNSRRLLAMVDDFLAISSIESRGIDFTMTMEPVSVIAKEAAAEVEPLTVRTGTGFSADIQDPLPEAALNHQYVHRAVMNLLYNAFTYTPGGGNVSLRVFTEERKGTPYVVFAVKDDGPGIPAHEVPRLFDRYYRSAGSAGIPGTGMGLSIVRAVAEAHGGTAEVDTEPGMGSEFRLAIPVRKI